MTKPSVYAHFAKNYEENLVDSLYKFVAINSVYDEETKDAQNPFGKGVTNALEFIKNLAIKDGFEATNYDNMVVEILCGTGKKNITIMAHADVVPAGSGWDQNPFEVVEKNKVFYGRGVADDKGPLLSAYYAMKLLRDNKLLGDYQIRFLVGGNEESGSLGIEHYFHHLNKVQPDLGFSPDSNYPLIYAEKGIINFEVKNQIKIPGVKSIEAGVASNSVIEKCEVIIYKDEDFLSFLKKQKVKFTAEDLGENVKITFIGKAAHGSIPWCGVNSGIIGLKQIATFYQNEELLEFANKFSDPYGKGLGVDAHNEEMFDNSMNVGIISYKDSVLTLIVNFRHINSVTEQEMTDKFMQAVKPGEAKVIAVSPILYYSRDSVLIKTLMKAYRLETGDKKSKPLTTGGGTYAKEASNIVAFGMEFPGWDARMHSPGERVKKKDLFTSIAIYARAIAELGKKLHEN